MTITTTPRTQLPRHPPEVAGVHGIRCDIPPGCRSRPADTARRVDREFHAAVLAGYLVLAFLIGQPPSRRAAARAAGAGLLFGAAWLTKDEAALLILVPLLAAAALGRGPRRSLNLIAAGVTTAT
jgi:hypothetical protein